ncbi:MAG TPA: hypothetical protein VFC75_02385, partial [Erysipelothrix sp.]|nr:hypothetical protein [Erysipelothrix sp.]
MVDNKIIFELIFAIILNIAYFAFFLIKFRKNDKYTSGILWGILAFFVSFAFTNFIGSLATRFITAETLAQSNMLQILVNATSQIMGIVFSSAFVFEMMDRRGALAKNSPSMVGFMSGSGILASPINMNSHMLVLTQLITNALFLNKGGSQLNKLPAEDIEEVRLFFASSPQFGFLAYAMYGFALAFGFWMLYQIVAVYRTQEDPSKRL